MIEQEARVVGVDGDRVEIEVSRQSACGSCNASKGCGTSLLADWFPKRHLALRLPNRIGARIGDRVVIGLDEGALQRATYTLYGLPLLALLGGAILGDRIAAQIGLSQELVAVTVGLLGMIVVLLWLRVRAGSAGRGVEQEIRLLRVAGTTQAIPSHSLMATVGGRSKGTRNTQ
ncbi:MAG: SoxR reducing system RseC family protein [Gammaproteobacteria bacterium]|nr:SoxR reducing system RseC family protein [Gammaproteobacteria bacterium]